MDKFEKLKELKKILDEGIITQEEFEKEKQKILNDPDTEDSILKSTTDTQTSPMTYLGIPKKLLPYILIGVLVLSAILFISINAFKKQDEASCSKSPKPFVTVYFDEDEVFPVYLFYLKNTKQGFMDLPLTNSATEAKNLTVTYGFTEFGQTESQIIRVAGGNVTKLRITPFSTKMLEEFTPGNATLMVKVTDEQNNAVYSNSWSLKMNPGDEIPWKIKNQDCSKLIASWVTPKNEAVEVLMRKAKDRIGGNLGSVDKMSEAEFNDLVKAIFNTVRAEGIAYINSTITFGEGYTQRVRLPSLTIKTKSANSIDGSVLLASLFENVGLRPSIVILPGHAIVGVSRPNLQSSMLFIETTLLGRSTLESIFSFETTFSAATKMGRQKYNEAYSKSVSNTSDVFTIIDVHKARLEGVLPIN